MKMVHLTKNIFIFIISSQTSRTIIYARFTSFHFVIRCAEFRHSEELRFSRTLVQSCSPVSLTLLVFFLSPFEIPPILKDINLNLFFNSRNLFKELFHLAHFPLFGPIQRLYRLLILFLAFLTISLHLWKFLENSP